MSKITQNTINKLNTIIDEFYLDGAGNVRRTKNGYYNRFAAGDLAGFYVDSNGYMVIQTPKQRSTTRKSHIIWLLHGNQLKVNHVIDHIDGNAVNDSIDNLRLIPYELNHRNRAKRSDNTSGVTGISWNKKSSKYVIAKTVGNERIIKRTPDWSEALIILEELKQLDSTYTIRHGN